MIQRTDIFPDENNNENENDDKWYIFYKAESYHEFVGSTSVALQMTFTNIVCWKKLKMKKINYKKLVVLIVII